MIRIFLPVSFFILLSYFALAQNSAVSITIHLRGVTESKISLLALSGTKAFKPLVEV
jgi:hypothetical protein